MSDPELPIIHHGDNQEPDWEITGELGGPYHWQVIDWSGRPIASGTRDTLDAALRETRKWST